MYPLSIPILTSIPHIFHMTGWETVKVPQDLIDHIEKFLKKDGKELGYTSRSQVVITSIREFLDRYRKFTFYLKHPKLGKIKFHKKGPYIFCAKHNSTNCKEIGELFRHQKLFDFTLLDDNDILSGVDYDKDVDITKPQKI